MAVDFKERIESMSLSIASNTDSGENVALNTFEIVTALTVVTIGAIISLYLIVLIKQGWLKGNTVETHFLCPNPKCRKPFAQPVLLADLSRTPPESHPACPHCGLDLNTVPYFKEKKKDFAFRNPQGAPLFKKPIERSQLSRREAPKPGVVVDMPKPGVVTDLPKVESVSPVPLKFQGDKKPSRKEARDCPHFFGYVKKLPKNTPIPDDCLGCPWIVECLTTEPDKIEA